MKNMTLETIAAVCNGTYYGSDADREKTIAGAVIDSRLVEQDYLFIPIKGARADGHTFIPEVFQKGALAVLSEHKLQKPAGAYILVDSCETALKQLAKFYRESLDIKVVGITGSVGKTSTKEMIASVLSQKYNVLKTEGNLNNEIGLPLTILKIRAEHEVAVLEMGISDFGEMDRLAQMAQPDICVITNIGLCHLENLIDRDGILKAKTECFAHMRPNGTAILNGDDDKLCIKTEVNGKKTVFYGIEKEFSSEKRKRSFLEAEKKFQEIFGAEMDHCSAFASQEASQKSTEAFDGDAAGCPEKSVYATDVEAIGLTGTKAVLHMKQMKQAAEKDERQQEEICFTAEIPIAGVHNVYNALAAAATARELGLSPEEIKRGIEAVQTMKGRGNVIHRNGITILDDCYNANPVSMKAAIEVLSKAEGRTIAVLGDMGELGTEEAQLHYEVGTHFAGKGITMLFCTGPLSVELARAVIAVSPDTEVWHFVTKEALIKQLKEVCQEGDTILVKASNARKFSEIVEAL